jgi:hypothetical protein
MTTLAGVMAETVSARALGVVASMMPPITAQAMAEV